MFKKMKLMRVFQNETGGSLIITMMTLFVLSIIGVTLATVTFANVKLTTTDREYQSTYYIAEAGVNQAYAEIRDAIMDSYHGTNSEGDFYEKIETALLSETSGSLFENFESSFGEDPEAKITVTEIEGGNPRVYRISSEGKIGQRNRTVTKEFTVNWTPKGGGGGLPNIPSGFVAMVKSKLDLKSEVVGDVYIVTGESGSVEMSGGSRITNGYLYAPEERKLDMLVSPNDFPEPPIRSFEEAIDFTIFESIVNNIPEPPVLSDVKSDIILENDNNFLYLELDKATAISNIELKGGATLTIDTKGKTIDLVVDNLEVPYGNGRINIVGDGKVNIHVKNKFNFAGGATINEGGNTGNFNLFYSGNDAVVFGNNIRVNGSFFNINAELTFNGGQSFTGYTVSQSEKKITVNNGAQAMGVFIAPYATMNVDGANIDGTVIVDKLTGGNGATIKFKNILMPDFPIGNGDDDESGGNTDGLLTPSPNIE